MADIFANKSLVTRGRIIGLHQANVHALVIAEMCNCNIKTVHLWIRKFREHGEMGLRDHRKFNCRPRLSTVDEDLLLIETSLHNPFLSSKQIIDLCQSNLSALSVNRRLKKYGHISARPAKKPDLTDAHRITRTEYARDYRHWTSAQWEDVIYTDEKSFSTAANNKLHVWRPRGERYNSKYVLPDNWSGRVTSNHWGCMSGRGLIALQPLSANFNGEEYVELLNECMEPAVREVYPDDDYPFIYFLQDNSPIHTSQNARDWFIAHPDFILLPHPPKSPDLNPIENVWAMMVKAWNPREPIRRKAQLEEYVREIWENISTKILDLSSTIRSMPKRLEDVLARDGYWTKY